ncbi:class II fructose-bisphosphatase [Magnetospirillum moscoviense]|uniref:Fructose-1,6-bisphosphatase n=1 Tax=Magnetospirillum moscoviense TaxID=1437059 RepID=A0A178N094_9PROT|nr:class II fructose-bisphosphatase [Magnetospirillum moscoviense]OAN67016.1 fructose 1,6-bisphosphatase [Magnetospirillum moscoviense]
MTELKDVRTSRMISAYDLRRATEAAARAAYAWIGRGDKSQGDSAAISALESELANLGLDARILIGEGPREETSQLYHGQRFGDPGRLVRWDIAVDPVEGTSFLAKGMTNALACLAIAPTGTLFAPGPAFYMEKFAAPPAAKGRIDPDAPVEDKLKALSDILAKPVEDLTIYVLEKPRHRDLVERIHALGARVALYPAGDVAGALMAAIPGSGIDALMGTGGCPEGMLSAAAIKVMGGEFMARIDPQLATERRAVEAAGIDQQRWWKVDELVRSDDVVFCATGITTGLLLEGIERTATHERTQTLLVGGGADERQLLTSWHRRAK